MRIHYVALVLSIPPVFALVACGSGQPMGESAAPSEQASASTSAVHPNHYHAELALSGQPKITADGKDIVVTVAVTNDGVGAFGSATEPHNVNLGAHALDAAHKVVINDLARAPLPQIAPGTTEKASILLPIDRTLNHSVELLPVQEGVGWFDAWGTRPLVLGPFQTCSSAIVGKVCDGNGGPLSPAPTQP